MLKLHQIYFRKFIALFVCLFLIVGGIIYFWLKDIYIQQIEKSLLDEIKIISLNIQNHNDLDSLAKRIKHELNARLTIIDSDGEIIAESHEDKRTMDNHKYREEIMDANKNSYGYIIRHSNTVNKDLLYIAKKFYIKNKVIYIRMAREIDKINEKLLSLAIKVNIILILFFILSFYIANRISTQLQNETVKISKFLLDLTKKKKNSFINSSFSQEFHQITALLTKVSRILTKQDKHKAKYTTKLKTSNDQKDDIISAISHEFKNPIAVINGYSQTLINEPNINTDIREKFLNKIHANGEKLSLLIDKLRLSVKLDEKKLTPSLIATNLNKLVEQNSEDIKQNFKNRNILIKADKKVIIRADQTLIEVAISNLIENALKYSEDDVEITINTDSISVSDHGIGINKFELEKITKKFYRVSNNDWNNSLGLGLSIVSNIIKLHNFQLNIKSKENLGSTFTIHF